MYVKAARIVAAGRRKRGKAALLHPSRPVESRKHITP
jgi:hypothetical protein